MIGRSLGGRPFVREGIVSEKTYSEFLEGKRVTFEPSGFEPGELNPMLFDWQKDVVRWACRKGRACLFEECGCGKTVQQLEWANQVCKNVSGGVPSLSLRRWRYPRRRFARAASSASR